MEQLGQRRRGRARLLSGLYNLENILFSIKLFLICGTLKLCEVFYRRALLNIWTDLVLNFILPSTSALLVTSFHVTPSSVEYSTFRPGSAALVSSVLPTNLNKKICSGSTQAIQMASLSGCSLFLPCSRWCHVICHTYLVKPSQFLVTQSVGKVDPVTSLLEISCILVRYALPRSLVPSAFRQGKKTREDHGVHVVSGSYCLAPDRCLNT